MEKLKNNHKIENILLLPDNNIIKLLLENEIKVDPDSLVNKLLLLKTLCIYLSLEEKEILYSENFDQLYLEYNGNYNNFKDKIIKKKHEYPFSVSTFSYLETYNENEISRKKRYNLDQLYLAAGMLNLDLILSPEKVYKKLVDVLPSFEWEKKNMVVLSNISEEDKELILNYKNYSYKYMNNRLRDNPDLSAPLNDIIDITNPLEKDIIVFRYIRSDKFLIVNEIFISTGYLSTSIDFYSYSELWYQDKNAIMLRIFVPKGKKAIFIPSHETELIFSHNIELKVIDKYMRDVVTDRKELVKMQFYDIKML